MNEVAIQLIIILLLGLSMLGLIWTLRRILERKHGQASSGDPILTCKELDGAKIPLTRVRILAFASEDCVQCRTLQAPVLRRVKEVHVDHVTVIEIDPSNSPELAHRYHVLTVPTTVLLDVKGKAHAINYGFTNAQSLLRQVDEILVLDNS